MRSVIALSSLAFATFFAASAVAKLDAWTFWLSAVQGWLPHRLNSRYIAVSLPLIEISSAGLLVVQPQLGFLSAFVLLAVFAVGAAAIASRRDSIACGCFGRITASSIDYRLAVRNVGLAGAAGGLAAAGATFNPALEGLGSPGMLFVGLASSLVLVGPTAWTTFAQSRKVRSEREGDD